MANKKDLARALAGDKNLRGADLIGADLRGANLTGADLSRADLTYADLSGAYLYGADLSGATLFHANLTRASLLSAKLTDANLNGANLTGANLNGAVLTDAVLTGTVGYSRPYAAPPDYDDNDDNNDNEDDPQERTQYNVGLFLNPKTFEMATGIYDNGTSEVIIRSICSEKYHIIARGNIEDGVTNGGTYPQSAERTGYPRAHAIPGVAAAHEGHRWGTCLYVAEAETARGSEEGQLQFKRGVVGWLSGVSSKPGTRTGKAENWWALAEKDGLAKLIRKCDVNGTVETNCESFDILTSFSCRKHKLVAAACGKKSLFEYNGQPPTFWQLTDKDIKNDYSYKSKNTRDALLGANVAYLAVEKHGKEAMVNLIKIMRAVGCTEEQIQYKIVLFNDKVDVTAPDYVRSQAMVESPPVVTAVRRRGRRVEHLVSNPDHTIVPTKIARPSIVFYGPRPNPGAMSKEVKKALEWLYNHRLEAGYGALQNLP